MSEIIVNGGRVLKGSVKVQGAKNAALPLLAAAILIDGESIIHNCPWLSDVENSLKILRHLGCRIRRSHNTVYIDSRDIRECYVPDTLMGEMRSSIIFLGGIAARVGRAKLCMPGGCELGPRPIDLHLCALRKMGMNIYEEHGKIDCRVHCLCGADINLSFPSVGATENIMIAAAVAKGITRIYNAAREPEITDLARFLRSAGARIKGEGTGCITIEGVEKLHSAEHTVMPDRIIAATYMAAAAVCGGEVTLEGVVPEHMVQINSAFEEAGCRIECDEAHLRITSPERLSRIRMLRTMPYPGFPTDAGPPLMSVMAYADGCSMLVENIFTNRFRYTDELKRLGADIKVEGRVAVVEGRRKLTAARVNATDLRGGAALVVAALGAEGTTVIGNIKHIDRGHEDFETNLALLGADIKRE